jgi:hypothetical protein
VADHGVNPVAVRKRAGKRLEDDDARAFGADVAAERYMPLLNPIDAPGISSAFTPPTSARSQSPFCRDSFAIWSA